MVNISKFLQKLIKVIPEFKKIHEDNKEYHEIGVHLIFGDFRRLAENAIENKNSDLLKRIQSFIIKCHSESKDEIDNAVFVSFFENMSEEGLKYFFEHLPKDFTEEIKSFLDEFDRATVNVEKENIKS